MIKLYPDGCTVKDRDGNVPLVSAIEMTSDINRRYEIVDTMITACPKSCEIKDKDGNLALHSACEQLNICLETIKALVKVYQRDANTKTKMETCLFIQLQNVVMLCL